MIASRGRQRAWNEVVVSIIGGPLLLLLVLGGMIGNNDDVVVVGGGFLAMITTTTMVVQAAPMQSTVNQRAKECLYDRVDKDESITMSLFILSGNELKATVQFHGPVASADVNKGKDLSDSIEKFDKQKTLLEDLSFTEVVDFEHLKLEDDVDNEDDEDDDPAPGKASADLTAEERKKRRANERKKALEMRQKRERQKHHQKKKVRDEGEPFQKTFKAPSSGWYRFCVVATWYQVTVEFDLRKESDMGGMGDDGHVMTFEEKVMAEEDRMLDEDTASEEGIKDEDFEATKDKLRTLRRLLADIQSKQQQERHRLILHEATNEHSHSRMVLSSLVETVLFMAVTGFQVYTIRKWFKGAPALGR